MTYPNSAGFERASQTSREAAASVEDQAKQQKGFLFKCLLEAKGNGLTLTEAENLCSGNPIFKNITSNNISARLAGLVAEERAHITEIKRTSSKTRRRQSVYVASSFYTFDMGSKPRQVSDNLKDKVKALKDVLYTVHRDLNLFKVTCEGLTQDDKEILDKTLKMIENNM